MTIGKTCEIKLRAIRETERTAVFVASTSSIDAYGESVEQSWRLRRFLANPVILWAHQSRELPIGVATRVGVVDGALECIIRFHTADKNPRAEQVWRMVRDGELKAVSVGFMPNSIRIEKQGDKEVTVLADNELHEISVCNIPANPEALAKMKAKALIASRSPAPAPLSTPPTLERRDYGDDLVALMAHEDEHEEMVALLEETPAPRQRTRPDLTAGDDLAELLDATMAAGGLEDGPDLTDLMEEGAE